MRARSTTCGGGRSRRKGRRSRPRWPIGVFSGPMMAPCSTGTWWSTPRRSHPPSPGAPARSTRLASAVWCRTRRMRRTRRSGPPGAPRSTTWALEPGRPIAGTKVDRVFIGSCTNSRMSDLRAAAAVARGRHVAEGVTAWVVPGSELVKRQAEAEGLDAVFRAAGFAWREPGCSMCVAANGERVAPGARSVSTSNRNLRGPARAWRPHPPGQPGDGGCGGGHGRDHRCEGAKSATASRWTAY